MLKLTAGAALFLLGTGLLGESLEGRCSRLLIRHLLGSPRRGFVTGLLATAAVQSSSAVTVLLGTLGRPLAESFPVIMGANVGSTVTAWLVWAGLSLPGLAVFLPVGLLVSVLIYLLKGWKGPAGFCLLLTGMEAMTSAAGGLGESGALREALLLAESPWRGVLLGAATTAALQSSGAAIGILQVLCAAGRWGLFSWDRTSAPVPRRFWHPWPGDGRPGRWPWPTWGLIWWERRCACRFGCWCGGGPPS